MNKIAEFQKISFDQFQKDFNLKEEVNKEELYNQIKLPKRATVGSAGHDFYLLKDLVLFRGETTKIPTGIRVKIDEGWVLTIYPRSSLGFKYKLQLDNTVGIIDSDYYNSSNEGHIFIKMTNHGDKKIHLPKDSSFAQGLFISYGITKEDNVSEIRDGGFGSTNKTEE